MDRAGHAIARSAIDMLGGRYGKRVVIVCGKGNNGGDGYAAARILKREGVSVTCLAVTDPSELEGAARHHHERARRAAVRITPFDLEKLDADLIVDAILGTGFAAYREGPDPHMEAVGAIQRLGQRDGDADTSRASPLILAVDIPSGISGERGVIGGTHVIADRTVTFAAEKLGTFLSPPEVVGEIEVVDIGIPCSGEIEVVGPDDVVAPRPRRPADSHKRSSGSLLVIAGSDAMPGAAALVARGAMRAGCGYVTVACTPVVGEVVHELCPEVLVRVVTDQDHLGPDVLARLDDVIERASVLAIGPGVGTGEDQTALVEKIVRDVDLPLVLDADGLNALPGRISELQVHKGALAITPHPRELAGLMDLDGDRLEDRIGTAREAARRGGCDVLLKGFRTVIAGSDEAGTYLNPTGGPELATAGTGDVLTGVVATFLAASRNGGTTSALAAAAYVHGLAGELAAREKSDTGVVAWDVAEALPRAIRSVTERAEVR